MKGRSWQGYYLTTFETRDGVDGKHMSVRLNQIICAMLEVSGDACPIYSMIVDWSAGSTPALSTNF